MHLIFTIASAADALTVGTRCKILADHAKLGEVGEDVGQGAGGKEFQSLSPIGRLTRPEGGQHALIRADEPHRLKPRRRR
jgi:hypothetical protein